MDRAGEVIDCCEFTETLGRYGWTKASGVPCSTFAGPIAHLDSTGCYEASANEGLALSSAAGAALAGQRQAVFLQNSGLGNLMNPLTSLVMPYGIPVLAFMSLRGWPDPARDEPQHAIMGEHGRSLLQTLGVWTTVLSDTTQWRAQLEGAVEQLSRGASAFVLMPVRSIGNHPARPKAEPAPNLPSSAEVAHGLADWAAPDTVIVATTGHLSRHLYAAGDRDRNFYMQGSMGHAAAIALGYADASPSAEVVVLDGDGAALMHAGVMSTIGSMSPPRLTHIVVDNAAYGSTGSQRTTSRTTDIAGMARACGYKLAVEVTDTAAFREALQTTRTQVGPHCIVVRSQTSDAAAPPRPSADLELEDVALRLARQVVTR